MKDTENKEFEISPELHFTVRLIASLVVLALIFFMGRAAITFCLGLFADGDHIVQLPGQDSPIVSLSELSEPEKPAYIDPSEVVEIARAEFTVVGDVMLHMPIVRTSQTADGYNFDDIFTYVKSYISGADYAVANLETTLSGTDGGNEYTGFPNFNSPDQIAMSARNAGFDMLLTGNNHSYDYGTAGLKRTLNVLGSYDLASLGTIGDNESNRHVIQSVGGVNVGMACYTFADIDDEGNVTINGITTDSAAAGLINVFDYDKLSQFYTEVEGEIAAMGANGADAIVVYIHWGNEYSTTVSDAQKSIAQKLCDLGVDVIIGSHPHVVQPMDLLTSSVNSEHKTVCLYSAGTFLSNLRADVIGQPTGHCEDGLLFNFTLTKYNDGTVRINTVSLIPTWVLVRGSGETRDFYILPLDQSNTDWTGSFNLSSDQQSDAKNSYNRTMELVTPGLNEVISYLSEKNSTLDPSLGVG